MPIARTVLITGASRGIGKHLALEFAKRGANVALIARDKALLLENAASIEQLGVKALVLPCNVRNTIEMRDAVRIAQETFGTIDIAILNAGVARSVQFNSFDSEVFQEVLDTNLHAAVQGVAAVAEVMKQQGYGIIAGISSLGDKRSIPGSSPYVASKSALSIVLEAASIELEPLGITVVTVRPGFITTDMTANNSTPMPFLMSAERAARIIADRLMRGKKYIAFPFPMALLSACSGMIPRVLWRRLFRVKSSA